MDDGDGVDLQDRASSPSGLAPDLGLIRRSGVEDRQ